MNARLKALETAAKRAALAAQASYASMLRTSLAQNKSPDGKAWAPHRPRTIRRWGPHRLLRLTGAMVAGLRVELQGLRVVATLPFPAGFHQSGTRHMVARPLFPMKGMTPNQRGELMKVIRKAVGE